ncbi:MAG: hypothetical protein RLZZ399_2142 [Verrucomicrobiota bacterium]|jgi:uncharacterized protein with NAD-binding domain and iron-sulfur cluster
MPDPQKQRISILGGGAGALSAALWLSESGQFDITVYQLGWRLGGKGASGRNAARGQRIEEHGLHIWCGMYENAFRTIRRAYEVLNRPDSMPLAKWTDAFKKHSFATCTEQVDGQWKEWSATYPENTDIPGDGGVLPSLWAYVEMTLELMKDVLDAVPGLHPASALKPEDEPPSGHLPGLHALWEELVGDIRSFFQKPTDLHRAIDLAKSFPRDIREHTSEGHGQVHALLSSFNSTVRGHVGLPQELSDDLRRGFIVLDLAGAILRGVLHEGMIESPETLFDRLDEYEFTDWIRSHGAHEITLNSAPVVGFYDFAFGFEKGDPKRRCFAAGTMLHAYARFVFTYKGALMWKMQAGMGDTIFGPMYEVLKNRGVRFAFFHRVDHLTLSADKKSIEKISLGVQATPKSGTYDPLVLVNGLPCWPSEPLYDQLKEGEELRRGPAPHDKPYNLESHWTSWRDVGAVTLEAGKDFDLVVLGIAVGALRGICSELMECNAAWTQMVEKVQTVQTQAFQIWLKPDAQDLGWNHPARAVLDAYVDPFNTWADMSQLLVRETWPKDNEPQNVAYFCGPMPDTLPLPEGPDEAFVRGISEQVKTTAIDWLNANAGPLWPAAGQPHDPKALNWALLYGQPQVGDERAFEGQYWRGNVDPTERYVISAPGSSKFRLRSWQSGFTNLYLAGDWTYNGFNLGCVEAAVTSGMQAAHAICGLPSTIVGELPPTPAPPLS